MFSRMDPMKKALLAALISGTALPVLAQAPDQPPAAAPPQPGAAAPAQGVQTFEGPIVGAKGDQIGKIAIRSSENATVVKPPHGSARPHRRARRGRARSAPAAAGSQRRARPGH